PPGVTKVMSTTSGLEVGLNTEMKSPSEPVVTPLAKYHCWDVWLAHGASDQPALPCTACVTATPPLPSTTSCATHVPELGAGTLGTSWPRAGITTEVSTWAPVSLVEVIVPRTVCPVVLVSTKVPSAIPPVGVVCPVQYQADDSVPGPLTKAAGVRAGPPDRAVPGVRAATATPATTTRDTATMTQRPRPRRCAGLIAPPPRALGGGARSGGGAAGASAASRAGPTSRPARPPDRGSRPEG